MTKYRLKSKKDYVIQARVWSWWTNALVVPTEEYGKQVITEMIKNGK